MVATCRKFRRASFTCVSLLAIVLATSARAEGEVPGAGAGPGHNNVAALYCLTLGYTVAVAQREPDGGQMGMCVFPDDSSCPEWDFYAGTCGAQWSLCAQRQLEQRNKTDGADIYAANYTACVIDDVEVRVSDLLGFPHRFNTSIGPIDTPGLSSPSTSAPSAPAPSSPTLPLRTSPTPKPEPPAPQAPNPLPATFTWRNKDGSDWMTSVKDQSQCGSCWAFSAVGATEAAFNVDRNNPSFDLDLSEELLNGGAAGSCCGGWHNSALDIIKNSGIPDEACLAYDVSYYNTAGCDCFGNPPCNASCTGLPAECSNLLPADACADMGTRLTTIADYFSVPNSIDTIKTRLIDEGPLSVCYAHQGLWNGNVYECPWGWCRGPQSSPGIACSGANDPVCPSGTTCQALSMNHCVVLAGYDDNNGSGFWILKNSWGAGFDADGYFNLRYDNCLIQNAVYYVDPGTTSNRPPVAVCAPVVKDADQDCCATVTATDVDGGSHDPDGNADIVTRCITRKDGVAVPCLPEVEVCGAGSHTVELTVRDAQGESSSCVASVTLQDVTPPVITCPPDTTLQCPANADPSVTGQATATDNCSTPGVDYADVVIPGCGGTQTVSRTWTAEDDAGNDASCLQTIDVVDTTPPDVTCSVARSELWPPNHKFQDVGFEFTATDTCDPDPPASEITVKSDEDPAGALGSGGPAHCPDAVVSGSGEVSLRAERTGTGDGRVYTVRVTATDACGNTAFCEGAVSVPKAQGGNHDAAVDSGQSFNATTCGLGASNGRGLGRIRTETRRSKRP